MRHGESEQHLRTMEHGVVQGREALGQDGVIGMWPGVVALLATSAVCCWQSGLHRVTAWTKTRDATHPP